MKKTDDKSRLTFKIFICEDDTGLSRLIQKQLDKAGYSTYISSLGKEAIEFVRNNPDSLLLLDYKLPDMTAKGIVTQLNDEGIEPSFIIMTGFGDEKIAVEMMKLGARDYLLKDSNFLELLPSMVSKVIDEINVQKKLKKAEIALLISEERQKLAFEGRNEGLWDWNIETNEIYRNPSFARILEIDLTDLGFSVDFWKSLIHPEDFPEVNKSIIDLLEIGQNGFEAVYRIKTKSGNWKWVHDLGRVIEKCEDGKPKRIIGTIVDITKIKKVEESLRESEEKYRALIENSQDLIMRYDKDCKFLFVSPSIKNFSGIDPDKYIGKTHSELNFSEQKAKKFEENVKKVFKTGKQIKEIIEMDGVNGNVIFDRRLLPEFGSDGKVKSVLATSRDITEQKRADDEKKMLELQLFQAQKMESIGRLAGGIAHDFNNILTGIMGYAEMLKMRFEDNTTREGQAADVILKGAEKAANLTKQLLGFARRGKFNPESLDLNKAISENVSVSAGIFEKNITVKYEFDENLKKVLADKNQIDQVLTNLIINAKDALPNGGNLVFKTENVYLDRINSEKLPEIKPGHYVITSLSDNGTGMPEEVKNLIFEPFYTTKAEGKGTGLGLAMVYGIIKNHHGYIYCESKIGKGTTFIIYLPVSEKEIVIKTSDTTVVKGNATILIVDDEEDVRALTKTQLESLGYETMVSIDGVDALKTYKQKKDKIDLVLLDMIMPRLSGKETFKALKKVNPNVKILLISGYSQDGKASEMLKEGILGFIQKPFRLHELSKCIVNALNNGKK